MVVIEPRGHENEQIPKPNLSSSKIAEDISAAPPSDAHGDASDGFETASEHEISGGEDDSEDRQQTKLVIETEAERQEQKERDSYEDALNDDELKQNALAQANDTKLEGNILFGKGQYEEALLQYESALQSAPEMPDSIELRSICHSNRAICFLKLGKYNETVKECTKALELNPSYIKALVRRGEAHEKLEHFEEAIGDMKKILELDPSNDQARKKILRLEPLAAEKREKMKEEMIAKLKDLGNSVLGRFGMSVDNFKAVKDPNSGSYSISFQQ